MKKCKTVIFVSLLLCALFLLSSCVSGAVKISGDDISKEEFRYFLFNQYRDLLDDGSGKSEDELLTEAKDSAIENIKRNCAIEMLAKENGVKLDDKDIEDVNGQIDALKAGYESEEEYEKNLEQSYLYPSLALEILQRNTLEDKLRLYMTEEYSGKIVSDDKTVEEDIKKNFCRATQILFTFEKLGGEKEAEAEAEKALAELQAGADFTEVARKYSCDTSDPETGYYFTHGQMLEEFENTAFSLKEGERSDIIKSDYGFHIIKRLPLDPDYIDEHFESLRELYKNRCFNEILEEKINGLKVEVSEKTVNSLFDEAKETVTLPEQTTAQTTAS